MGRRELAPNLAAALMNKGNALQSLGQLREAIASHDAALELYQLLVEEQGRTELAPGLAKALLNKGLALQRLG
jgi:tetratricopeptide (TPR) repeat protein